jgi:flagella basal body P-ring formation protein FlgA
VVVISKSGAVTARLKGVALKGGDRGDLITVRVPRYRNDIPATVIDRGLVEAAAGF